MDMSMDRRRFGRVLAGFGLGSAAAVDRLWGAQGNITDQDLQAAAQLAGLEMTPEERELMLEGVQELRDSYQKIREVGVDNSVPPAIQFDPRSGGEVPEPRSGNHRLSQIPRGPRPKTDHELAFLPVTHLSALFRRREITSVELTTIYLDRLKRFGPELECVITLTEDRAMAQAKKADQELAQGTWRGPLHGMPWGAKDLLSASGYPTTWGAAPYQGQVLSEDASVVRRLDDAGAVLVAKLTLGALAWGDVWYGGTTKNPWNLEQGSSGSSAGPASATAAGLVAFSMGSETWGSIVSPSTRCGTTGLRPTFGRISRHGAMALSWSMDKLGPICRSVEDCALVFSAIHGADGLDPTAVTRPFTWHSDLDTASLRVGYIRSAFEEEPEEEDQKEWHRLDLAALEVLESLGLDLVPLELPDLPVRALSFILSAEAAAAFDELTRSGRDDLLVRQIKNAWPNTFREARTIPAVEYIQANRVRTLLMREMDRILQGIDVYVCPSFGGNNLLLTNLTGHPAVVLPHGFRADGTPVSITFNGNLDRDAETLALAHHFQQATGYHLRHPERFMD